MFGCLSFVSLCVKVISCNVFFAVQELSTLAEERYKAIRVCVFYKWFSFATFYVVHFHILFVSV